MQRILLVDNYDSYTLNLHQLLVECAHREGRPVEVLVIRNDQLSW